MTDDSLDEDPLPQDQDPSDETGEIPCPYCSEFISELAEVCPHCKSYISREGVGQTGLPLRTRVIAAILIVTLSGLALLLLR
jgi:hypothetical protein